MESTVVARHEESADTITLRLSTPETFRAHPGQFIMLGATLPSSEREIRRSYSVAAQEAGWIEVTVKAQAHGLFSPYVCALPLGAPINVYGPFGRHFTWEAAAHDANTPLVFIAGGTGIAPFRAMVHAARASGFAARGGTGTVLFSVRTANDVLYRDELPLWECDGFRTHITLTRPTEEDVANWKGAFGRMNEKFLRETLGDALLRAHYYVCGPTPLVVDMQTVLGRIGVPAAHVRTEKYGAIEG
jgi:ferredoxin-NADP reductase